MQTLWTAQVENPQKFRISEETNALIDKLLLERLPLAGIVRVIGVSKRVGYHTI